MQTKKTIMKTVHKKNKNSATTMTPNTATIIDNKKTTVKKKKNNAPSPKKTTSKNKVEKEKHRVTDLLEQFLRAGSFEEAEEIYREELSEYSENKRVMNELRGKTLKKEVKKMPWHKASVYAHEKMIYDKEQKQFTSKRGQSDTVRIIDLNPLKYNWFFADMLRTELVKQGKKRAPVLVRPDQDFYVEFLKKTGISKEYREKIKTIEETIEKHYLPSTVISPLEYCPTDITGLERDGKETFEKTFTEEKRFLPNEMSMEGFMLVCENTYSKYVEARKKVLNKKTQTDPRKKKRDATKEKKKIERIFPVEAIDGLRMDNTRWISYDPKEKLLDRLLSKYGYAHAIIEPNVFKEMIREAKKGQKEQDTLIVVGASVYDATLIDKILRINPDVKTILAPTKGISKSDIPPLIIITSTGVFEVAPKIVTTPTHKCI